jgi:hypothetical protein
MSIELPVSVGEAIDKLTILDIKCKKIKDEERLKHCKHEYDLLYNKLKDYVQEHGFYYKLLYDVNECIWDMQDEIRIRPDPQKCVEILDKNDMRFRIKDVINQNVKSYIREQKGYPKRRALVIGHMGIGDHIGLIGAVRWIALQHDETFVVCKQHYAANVQSFFEDNPTIKLWVVTGAYVNGKYPTNTVQGESVLYNPEDWTNVYRSGFYKLPNHGFENLPSCFYLDMGIDPAIRHTHFYLPTTEEARQIYRLIRDEPYIFVQQRSSNNFTKLITWNIDDIFTIDPNTNVYEPGHKWYELAQRFVNLALLSYTEVIKHAKEIHTVDSSFYCMACYLTLDAEVKRCYNRDTGILIPTYDFT